MTLVNHARLNSVLLMSKQHQAQLLQMINTMLADADANIVCIQQHAAQENSAQLQQMLHKLRGAYATLGAEQLASLSQDLEHALETGIACSQLKFTDFIRVYRQTCTEIQTVLTQYQPDTPLTSATNNHPPLNTLQLFTLLQQQDMQAGEIARANLSALEQLLTPLGATKFSQYVSELNFAEAATMLQPFVTAACKAKTQ